MFIERMLVQRFRHLRDVELGPFREPSEIGELIVLAGPNGGGKSSLLELLSRWELLVGTTINITKPDRSRIMPSESSWRSPIPSSLTSGL